MSLDRPHFQLLAAFKEFGRLGDAARSLHLSPSAASHRLAEAERRAGTRLTESVGRTLRFTPAGEHLATTAAELEAIIERAMLTTRWIGTGEPSRIRVGVGFYDTPGWLLDTFTTPPGAPRIELLRFGDDALLDAVRNQKADVAIAPWPKLPSGLQNVPLGLDKLVAAVPAGSTLADGNPIHASELHEVTFLTSDYRASRGFEFHEFFLAADVVPITVVQVQSLEMMLRLVGNGDGVTIQPSRVLTWNRPHSNVEIVPLEGRDIVLAWTATHRIDADDEIVAATNRIAGAFAAAAERGEGDTSVHDRSTIGNRHTVETLDLEEGQVGPGTGPGDAPS
ncbi:MAG: LysR family transcriptional regulator [Actinomycetia bacterium]|nr:LysR family transcriptional regulator [Actinomycetes bacterium]